MACPSFPGNNQDDLNSSSPLLIGEEPHPKDSGAQS